MVPALLSIVVLVGETSASTYVVHTRPPAAGATVYVDGREAAITDENGKAALDTVPGDHRIRLEKDDRLLFSETVFFDSIINLVEIDIDSPVPGPSSGPRSSNTAVYVVETNVPGASVSVDGHHVGVTSSSDAEARLELPVGRESVITISRDGFAERTVRLVAEPRGGGVEILLEEVSDPQPANSERGKPAASGLSVFLGGIFAFLLFFLSAVVFVLLRKVVGGSARSRGEGAADLQGFDRFDRFVINGIVGSGGVATIYDAVDSDGRRLALKVLDKKWLDDPEMVRKFLSEAEALDSVRRIEKGAPVVRVLGSGREGGHPEGLPFIALELLEGEDLEHRINRRGCLKEKEVVGIGLQIVEALVAMKAAGVVHRDLTPDNIFLVDDRPNVDGHKLTGVPRVVLIDFGVARQEFLARVTMDGSIAGKPPYMSPEQCRGEEVDYRSDLYALGLVLYAMSSGAPPFTGRNPFEVMKAQEEQEPPSLGGKVSPALGALILELLKKNPDERPASPSVVKAELLRLL